MVSTWAVALFEQLMLLAYLWAFRAYASERTHITQQPQLYRFRCPLIMNSEEIQFSSFRVVVAAVQPPLLLH